MRIILYICLYNFFFTLSETDTLIYILYLYDENNEYDARFIARFR